MSDKPATVKPRQLWRDTDPRTVHDEMLVEAVVHADGSIDYRKGAEPDVHDVAGDVKTHGAREYAVVRRRPGGFLRVIAVGRMLETDATRGYEYLGMDR